ncbi:hypothetical protein SLA2020_011230 [Shorea laevis]
MAGKATLISSVLASIPNFYMQVMWLPSSVHKEIDRISKNFLWGSMDSQHKIHSIGWEIVCLPKNQGGLGFRSAKNANIVAMSKLNWKLHIEKDKSWREVLVKKYNINDFSFSPSSFASPVIKCISKGIDLFKYGVKYIPLNGQSISFWFDHWVGVAPLSSILFGPFTENTDSILLFDVLSNGAINTDAIGYILPYDLIMEILAIPLSNLPSMVDGFSWQGKSTGIFSSASAYRDLVPTSNWLPADWNWIWNAPTLPKIQLFLWQLAYNKNQRNLFPYKQQNFDSQRTYGLIVERAIEFWSSKPLPPSRTTKPSRLISWDPPPPNWLKLNTDGSAASNPKNAGCGGLFRDSQGHWVVGFIRNIGHTIAIAVELYAIRDGLNIAVNHHFPSVIVETNCQVAYLLLTSAPNVFHPYSTLIMDCKALLNMIPQVQVKNILREANMVADALAKKGVSTPHGFNILYICPPEVDLLCTVDYVGVSYPRL